MFIKTRIISLAIVAALLGICPLASSTNLAKPRLRKYDYCEDRNPNLTHIICRPPAFKWGGTVAAIDGVHYLHFHDVDPKGHPVFAPNSQNYKRCSRVSCSYGTGIYVCNDNNYGIQIPLLQIADYAQAILDQPKCNDHLERYRNSQTIWGQAFDVNGCSPWTVFITSLFEVEARLSTVANSITSGMSAMAAELIKFEIIKPVEEACEDSPLNSDDEDVLQEKCESL
ncbi:hypothetical protein VM1G_11430 [Cytospora mali]|uniref:Uncharacterized protein n=1 Tax=Cytospora mali TaxID=578113 RepID=A0A194VQK1_CYTMA|nr:hypothetical protein VM1G_11430 [Valsa mali]